ncbi:condensation domain-containing protein [Streptomyces sp. NBC_00690]|uniref:condensation domain-containing protein n=1 Tax=Streptomyces sp. NBC_00690 TaxID=2975808 RepID=UPI002E29EED7|nr:condensation domain-containing protein [Streptomyces sp. NBC_00690]
MTSPAPHESSAQRRKELVARRLRAAGISDARTKPDTAIPRRSDPRRAPLSFAQQHAWSYQQAHPDSVANNLCLVLTATGTLDLDALGTAFAAVVDRHEVLRTTYHADPDGEPYQYVHPTMPPPIIRVDLGALSAPARQQQVDALVEEAVTEPFDLAKEGPLRLRFLRHSRDSHTIVLLIQHIVWDGMTLAAISKDLRNAYELVLLGKTPDTAVVHPQYADYAEWEQRIWRERPSTAEDHAYWRQRLTPPAAPLALPYREGAPAVPSDKGAREDRRLTGTTPAQLRELARTWATTPFVVFLACYAEVLRDRAQATDISLGTLAVDRDHPGTDRLVGNFSNPVVLRFDLAGATDFADLVRRVQDGYEPGFVHRGYPFLPLANELAGHDGTGRVPFFDSLVVFVAQDIEGPDLPGVRTTWERADNGAAQFPLVPLGLEVFVREAGIDVQFTYSTDMFDRETVRTLLDDLDSALRRASGTRS